MKSRFGLLRVVPTPFSKNYPRTNFENTVVVGGGWLLEKE